MDIRNAEGSQTELDPNSTDNLPDDQRRSRSRDLDLITRPPYPNALLIGSPSRAQAIVTELLIKLDRPVAYWFPTGGQHIPAVERGTLVIWNMDTLTAIQQWHLLTWIAANAESHQVISVATARLFARVKRGEFLQALYYQLNVVRIDVDRL